jgi:hypothetical protein
MTVQQAETQLRVVVPIEEDKSDHTQSTEAVQTY